MGCNDEMETDGIAQGNARSTKGNGAYLNKMQDPVYGWAANLLLFTSSTLRPRSSNGTTRNAGTNLGLLSRVEMMKAEYQVLGRWWPALCVM